MQQPQLYQQASIQQRPVRKPSFSDATATENENKRQKSAKIPEFGMENHMTRIKVVSFNKKPDEPMVRYELEMRNNNINNNNV